MSEIVGLGIDVDAVNARIAELQRLEADQQEELAALLSNQQAIDTKLLSLHRIRLVVPRAAAASSSNQPTFSCPFAACRPKLVGIRRETEGLAEVIGVTCQHAESVIRKVRHVCPTDSLQRHAVAQGRKEAARPCADVLSLVCAVSRCVGDGDLLGARARRSAVARG